MAVRRVGVLGAAGRMGATVCEAVDGDPDLELVAAVDATQEGLTAGGLAIGRDPQALRDAGAEVVVDFTVAEAVRENLPRLASWGLHAVVGTTGLGPGDLVGCLDGEQQVADRGRRDDLGRDVAGVGR